MQLKLILYEEDFQMQTSHSAAIPAISITIIIIGHFATDLFFSTGLLCRFCIRFAWSRICSSFFLLALIPSYSDIKSIL